ncbi:MAG: Phenylalanine-tRNA ligase alpha subunit [Candidatus Nomurabacteria bacterium GW2011_GWE1_32_28]|uniref:phenylalanine--tRNA ligase n=1 Tax=Candidatus Nomurabacteria bacterium GW2011_GWF1_31_48 TaxID=1618767 RepID=A0A0G0BGN6_9BACT|nr:MAG: Phenylalanine-tRNA ligase alpha subunit [Candidatus Nomurabacteria bacterium GW2011_GWF2_30_133]KKP28631.1 MAG: Phenylalanine-tRNA ligase alpha subunit [Candidatus Nomurabacteria bacterium GW2011_GWE2_31_40]KKP30207.1 MAG: Phenylalanine-tRNA ligase alpha subunit [Candidatus Nomurabacteria bacterium GW2011_GWF1_31_48]KKP34733.1 MAG: Phenylalanine-tRNA ligase alpha subunit [Candidatus Nomurabacteria bacterium GW2011_GWE1_32_28]HAS80809.1 phenylalanine--tRNA ligase subunit alpha [Candidatu
MENEEKKGREHPLSIIINEAVKIFTELGFEIATGPELEDIWHNFDALNIPKDHPAREMQDTFYIKGEKGKVLRTHTSNVQIRYMEDLVKSGGNPPFAIIAPGKCFRNEATDATHEMQFYQIEGLMIGEDIDMAHLKGVLSYFYKKMLGEEIELRFRPSFFPFTEPSIEFDLKFNGKWLEMGGAGMVHPNVLKNCGIDSLKYQGFAFGPGLERLMVIKYGMPDIRPAYQGDLRFNQF